MIEETINTLGCKAMDKVTGFSGVISSISFDLYGCVCAVVAPPLDKDGKLPDGKWFDVQRLNITNERVMPVPAFSAVARKPSEHTHGAAEKPAR